MYFKTQIWWQSILEAPYFIPSGCILIPKWKLRSPGVICILMGKGRVSLVAKLNWAFLVTSVNQPCLCHNASVIIVTWWADTVYNTCKLISPVIPRKYRNIFLNGPIIPVVIVTHPECFKAYVKLAWKGGILLDSLMICCIKYKAHFGIWKFALNIHYSMCGI